MAQTNQTTLERLREKRQQLVTHEEGVALMKTIGAVAYHETSALTQEGVQALFNAVIHAATHRSAPKSKKERKAASKQAAMPQPPVLPKGIPAPWINVSSSTFAEDMRQAMAAAAAEADVTFVLRSDPGGAPLRAHAAVLCAASKTWRRLLVDSPSVWRERKPVSLMPSAASASCAVPEKPLPEWLDPVTDELMLDPVIASDGRTYERAAMIEWLSRHNTSPTTNEPLASKDLVPAADLKAQIDEFIRRTGWNTRAAPQVSVQQLQAASPFGCYLIEAIQLAETPRSATKNDLVVVMTDAISRAAMERLIEFWYTGLPGIPAGACTHPCLPELEAAAAAFSSEQLETICKNIEEGREVLNPSIGTFLNDETGKEAKALLLGKELFADVSFKVGERVIPVHRCIVGARCGPLASMMAATTTTTPPVEIPDASPAAFLALLEFIYTDHAPIDDMNSPQVEVLRLAHRFRMPRLTTLDELYISKAVEEATRDSVSQCELGLCGILEAAQQAGAQQLEAFMKHFCCTNFGPISQRADFAQLSSENKKYIDENQWPPKSYLQEVANYEKAIAKLQHGGNSGCRVM